MFFIPRVLVVIGYATLFVSVTVHGQESPTATNPAVVPVSRDADKKWIGNGYKKMDAELAKRDLSAVDIVFVGDSITRHWINENQGRSFWDESFPNGLNLAMGGDRTEHVLHRLQSKADGGRGNFDDALLQPKSIVLMIGTNNLFRHEAPQIIEGIKAVVARLKELRPNAKLIVCSVLPTHKKDFNQDKVIPINNAVSTIEAIHWLDLYQLFLSPSGEEKNDTLYRDGLHLNAEGYKVWRDALVGIINQEK